MNILEALKAIDEGQVVRSEVGREINFFYQATLWPYGSKTIHRIATEDLDFDEKIYSIQSLHECADDDFRICVSYLRSEGYSTVTQDEMIAECEKIRKEKQEEE